MDKNTPYRLKDILPIAYPNGGMTLTGLRREIAKGNLVAELTAGRHFVTMRAIEEMREKCRGQRKARASGSESPGWEQAESSSPPDNGSSSTVPSKSQQAALEERLQTRSENLRRMSSTTGARRAASEA